jgi:hypothetical protein
MQTNEQNYFEIYAADDSLVCAPFGTSLPGTP